MLLPTGRWPISSSGPPGSTPPFRKNCSTRSLRPGCASSTLRRRPSTTPDLGRTRRDSGTGRDRQALPVGEIGWRSYGRPSGTPPSVFKPPVRARRSIRFKSWHVVVALGGLVLLAITAWGLLRSGGKSEYAAKTPIPKAESQIAELQGKIKNWRASRDKLKVLLEQLKKDKATILQQLTELGISSQDDLGKNPKAQVLSQEAQDIVRQIAVDEKKFQEFDLAVLKCESQVRTISRQISAKEAGVSDLGFDELTRNMIALDESLAKEKDFTLPADFKDTLRDELTNSRQEQQKGAALRSFREATRRRILRPIVAEMAGSACLMDKPWTAGKPTGTRTCGLLSAEPSWGGGDPANQVTSSIGLSSKDFKLRPRSRSTKPGIPGST